MATKTIKKSGLKESIKKTETKAKNYAIKTWQSAKEYLNKYKIDIRKAYDVGYSKGWDDAYDIPNRIGTKTASALGYKTGVACRIKADKYTKDYKKIKK